jgi:hypothetical protein
LEIGNLQGGPSAMIIIQGAGSNMLLISGFAGILLGYLTGE